MPGTVWNILRISMHLILTITLWDSTIFIPHFTDKETKVQQLSILSQKASKWHSWDLKPIWLEFLLLTTLLNCLSVEEKHSRQISKCKDPV